MFKIIGFPEKGRGIGKELGFPTINFVYNSQKIKKFNDSENNFGIYKLKDSDFGVYAAEILILNNNLDLINKYLAAVNFGGRPTIDQKLDDDQTGKSLCEAFILDFDSNFEDILENYSQTFEGKNQDSPKEKFEINLLKKIREIKKFPSIQSLKIQIESDVDQIRKYFA